MKISFNFLAVIGALVMAIVATPSEAERDRLTFAELNTANTDIDGPVDNRYFMPVGPVGAGRHQLSGTLIIPETDGWSFGVFPGVSIQLFTSGNLLIPVAREIVRASRAEHSSMIVSPGRVWSEPDDNGLTRASFPFVLARQWPHYAQHGLATFLFDDQTVSPLVFQFGSESYLTKGSKSNPTKAWGRLPISLSRGTITERDQAQLAAEYQLELEKRLPTRPLITLAEDFGVQGQDALRKWPASEDESVSGILIDGVIYFEGCQTRFGRYPYCDEMRHNVFSMTKSLGGLVAILRLAQKYGDHVFDLKIKDFSNVPNDATFGDSINMTTGGPFRYSDTVTNVLAGAMDNFLKSREGPDANVWDMVLEEVLKPIGVFHAPVFRFSGPSETNRVPVLSGGLFPTFHDIAKIARLFQNGGRHRGEQLLSQDKTWQALYRTKVRGALVPDAPSPGVGYYMSFWQVPVELDKCTINVSLMSGSGGKIAVLLPSGTVAFYVRNGGGKNYVQELSVAANALRPECR